MGKFHITEKSLVNFSVTWNFPLKTCSMYPESGVLFKFTSNKMFFKISRFGELATHRLFVSVFCTELTSYIYRKLHRSHKSFSQYRLLFKVPEFQNEKKCFEFTLMYILNHRICPYLSPPWSAIGMLRQRGLNFPPYLLVTSGEENEDWFCAVLDDRTLGWFGGNLAQNWQPKNSSSVAVRLKN